jgi:gas vesicle protein
MGIASKIDVFGYIKDLTSEHITQDVALILAKSTIKALDSSDIATNENVNYQINEAKTEFNQKIDDVKTELNQKIDDVKTELKQDIAEVRAEAQAIKTELKQDIADVKKEVAEIKAGFDTFKKEIHYELKIMEQRMIVKMGIMMVSALGLGLGAARLIF